MKLAKSLGLAALAAIVATALVGASSATAAEHESIVLCKVAELPCEPSNWHPNPTTIHAESVGEVLLLTSLGNLHCKESLAIVTLLNKLAKLVEGHILELNYKKCYRLKLFGGTEECTVTVNALGGLSLTPAATKLSAEVKLIPLEGKTTNWRLVCGEVINCTYEAGEATKLTVHSDAEGHLLLLAIDTPLAHTGGGICPETAKLDATYESINLDEALTPVLGLYIEN